MSDWWQGEALDQDQHEAINAVHYPGTRQLCCQCDQPTGRCEDDEIRYDGVGPLCEECGDKMASTTEGNAMSETKHTPWTSETLGSGDNVKYLVYDSRGVLICEVENQSLADTIAAAPDLLAACEWLIDQMRGESGTGETYWMQFPDYRDAVAAVSKAKGAEIK